MIHHRLSLGVAFCLTLSAVSAQKQLTNRDIWASPQFSAEYVGGLASMNDGQHYTVLDGSEAGMVIDQYAYRTGQKVSTIVDGTTLVPAGAEAPIAIDGYRFSVMRRR
ncbi:MAG TPA: hypothetical protein PKJ19_09595 [Flavobacteriales bacterium]|nr:hypothetical protein [Flavobacteriales bacterium]